MGARRKSPKQERFFLSRNKNPEHVKEKKRGRKKGGGKNKITKNHFHTLLRPSSLRASLLTTSGSTTATLLSALLPSTGLASLAAALLTGFSTGLSTTQSELGCG